MPDGRFYCFGSVTVPEGGSSPSGERAEVRRRFADWPEPIPALLDAVPEDAVIRHDIYDLPLLPGYVRGRVALLGDAAHAMTPHLGQGACQAIEDAVVLAACLDETSDIGAALARYDELRRRRTQRIVRRSAHVGAATKLTWPPAVLARDLAARLIPARVTLRSMAPILSWRP
jgi:2-polyprenyl-6-methoxyphenol hydroxylase-like FAD-dependent oxidoreductase